VPGQEFGSLPDDLMRSLVDAMRLLASTGGPGAASAETGTSPNGDDRAGGDAAQLLGRLSLVWMTSGIRYWARAAEIWARALPSLARALADSGAAGATSAGAGASERPAEARKILIDELRACLRLLAELPVDEGRRVQAELEAVLRGAGEEPSGPADQPWRRRWKAKD